MKSEDGNKTDLNGTIDNHKMYSKMNKSVNENPQEINFTYLFISQIQSTSVNESVLSYFSKKLLQ